MADLTLYTNPMSRGRIARWMVEETGQPYETIIVPFGPAMKSADYRAVNPMGKVPAVRHGDVVVTECAAICAYLADTFPEAKLAPPNPQRGSYYRWLFFAAGPLEAAVSNRSLGFEVPDERRRMIGYGSFQDVMDTLEIAVSTNPFVAGQAFTAADVYVGSHIAWGLQFGSIEKRQAFADYLARVSDRPAFQRAREKDDAAAAAMQP
ncbi:MAG: glutathione S-transferase family protein [Alphaproteobacteria bacterium]|nr:glutathione S-transferase family protein [Rhizobiaceae bacterium]MBU3960669.1 glutathione S-transferase family protein [Alphaproteobacteria bacterium]MBU4049743.1 glutathione S-transferase family protein [Alphaproteobacteria bacterium]MBU4087363.1 glutathione S-transferase family protein [Alphaproteobacteria bacterium]MBU4155050.1 glutathione S-transferase family protein [Alphaproteobacteria bacterium]